METAPSTTPTSEMALNARIIDFTSKVNGRAYRLFVSIPTRRPVPAEGHAVVYLIDGNLHFGIAVDTARIQACWPDVIDPVVVGIGYPTDSVSTALDLRMIDLTTPISEERLKKGFIAKMPRPSEGWGGMDNYFRVIEEEVKPRVEAMVAINRQDQVLMGHSLGGLTTCMHSSATPRCSSSSWPSARPSGSTTARCWRTRLPSVTVSGRGRSKRVR
jgi:uncharacterized protein